MPYPGQPKDTPIPAKLDRWNWGAFLLNWIWGLGNSTYIALLMFVPFVNFILIFILGAKGSKWAWKNRIWEDEAHFIRTQRNWAKAGIFFIFAIIALTFALIFGIVSLMKSSDAYKMTMAEIRKNTEVIEMLGEPIEAGWFVTGQLKIGQNGKGSANYIIPISGPKGDGKAISVVVKTNNVWQIKHLTVQIENSNKIIKIIGKKETAHLKKDNAQLLIANLNYSRQFISRKFP